MRRFDLPVAERLTVSLDVPHERVPVPCLALAAAVRVRATLAFSPKRRVAERVDFLWLRWQRRCRLRGFLSFVLALLSVGT